MSNLDEFVLIPTSATPRFVDVFEKYSDFETAYKATPFKDAITDENLEILYYILYARYGNSSITNFSENQFKYKLFNIIWQYGPTWEKRLTLQADIRALSNDDILKGATVVYNHAFNPSTEPSTQTQYELPFINDQNVTKYDKTQMDAFTQLWDLLVSDVTEEFVARFKPLFKKFISPYTDLFVTDKEN